MPQPARQIAASDTSFSVEWAFAAPLIERALIGTHTLDDVRGRVEAGQAQLWLDEAAAVVTEIVVFPRKRVLRGWLAAGKYAGIRRIEQRVIPWAKENGCQEIQIIGRLGWRRRLKDYRESAVTMTKEI